MSKHAAWINTLKRVFLSFLLYCHPLFSLLFFFFAFCCLQRQAAKRRKKLRLQIISSNLSSLHFPPLFVKLYNINERTGGGCVFSTLSLIC